MTKPHILVVEDEPKLAALLRDYLEASGYDVAVNHEGSAVTDSVHADEPDAILLDLMLPGKDGLTICREIRAFSNVPIIMITARVEEIDRLLGLELGADDYICKPFSPREVVARVKAVLRRSGSFGTAGADDSKEIAAADSAQPNSGPSSGSGNTGLVLDEEGYLAHCNGNRLDLTPAEFRLLLLFVKHTRRAWQRERLLDALYDDRRVVTDRTIDTHVKNLRRKLAQAGAPEGCITSVYGVGYRFDGI